MNYSRAFSYVFEDKNWFTKILIAGLFSLIPIIGQLYLMGWTVEIVRRVKAGRTDVIPTTHFSYFLTLGLKMFVVALIYSIPVLILSGISNLVTGSGMNSDQGFFAAILTGIGCLGGILTFVVNIAVAVLGVYGMIKLAETDQIKACLDFSDAFYTIKKNLKLFVIVTLFSAAADLIGCLGLIICIGIILTIPYASAVSGHLVGQLWDNLEPYDKSVHSVRGNAVNTVPDDSLNDVIEEAPFTKVEDIEKHVEAEVKETAEEIQETAAAAAAEVEEAVAEEKESFFEEAAAEAEAVIEDAAENIAEAAEESAEAAAEKISEAAEAPKAEEKPEDNDVDLPSFE